MKPEDIGFLWHQCDLGVEEAVLARAVEFPKRLSGTLSKEAHPCVHQAHKRHGSSPIDFSKKPGRVLFVTVLLPFIS